MNIIQSKFTVNITLGLLRSLSLEPHTHTVQWHYLATNKYLRHKGKIDPNNYK